MRPNVIKAEQRTKLQRLTAPIDGVVQQLVVHTIGGVVTPVQALAVVVPSQAPLEIETMDPTAILDSSIPARRWKSRSTPSISHATAMLLGKVISLPSDAITRDKQPARSNGRTASPASHSETQGQSLGMPRASRSTARTSGSTKSASSSAPHGRDGRNQNRLAQNQLSAIAASKIPPRLLAGTIKSQVLLGIFIEALPILTRRHIANAVDHLPKRHTDLSAVIRLPAFCSALDRAS
jgi:hypothetical protein